MKDFASASMVRVLAEGMRMLGIRAPPAAASTQAGKAIVPLDLKRQLVEAAVGQAGIGCLPRLGQGVKAFLHEPTHQALCTAGSPQELMRRWRKLERYIHSRHRTEVVLAAEGVMTVRHFSLAGHPPPLPAEDLVVLGVLAALMDVVGARQLQARIGGIRIYPECDVPGLAQLMERQATGEWQLSWQGLDVPAPARAPVAAVEAWAQTQA